MTTTYVDQLTKVSDTCHTVLKEVIRHCNSFKYAYRHSGYDDWNHQSTVDFFAFKNDVFDTVKMPYSTFQDSINTLVKAGYLNADEAETFTLTPRLQEELGWILTRERKARQATKGGVLC